MRIGVYLGLFVGVGGVFFAAWIGGPERRESDPRRVRIGIFSAVASLGLQGIDLLNLPLSGLSSSRHGRVRCTSLGPSLLIAIVAMARRCWQSPSMAMAWKLTGVAMAA